ncbi:MAG: hypothetical protein L0H74_07375 [Brachybacterium sp.]|nr:hypothetical protein [Brachybacterium sp.]MDN5899871.1 hypothetical protein [Brachybacterium sp.]
MVQVQEAKTHLSSLSREVEMGSVVTNSRRSLPLVSADTAFDSLAGADRLW